MNEKEKDTKGNTGDCNAGHGNTGNFNTGNYNTGNYNAGKWNTGKWNTGKWNTGDWNIGNYNTGNCNVGLRNTGGCNTGSWNTGNYNTGHFNTGNYNTGDWNTGDWNTCRRSSGCFNTVEQTLPFFNKPSNWTYRDWVWSDAHAILCTMPRKLAWVDFADMTADEKLVHPDAETVGGCLKEYSTLEQIERVNWWRDLPKNNQEAVMSMPNFDKEIFKQITGIDVDAEWIDD